MQQADSTLQLVERLSALGEVEYAEPNYRVYISESPSSDALPTAASGVASRASRQRPNTPSAVRETY